MKTIKAFKQEWWPKDLEMYLKWKEHAEKYPSDVSNGILQQRRERMVLRYGKAAMKDI